ncbi:MAG TPA: LysR family transcriptional regulator [Marinobacter sp.]|nr:LysR family transcriptional regulator [Marinobacter sp.]
MELRHLRYFLAAAEAGNLTRAAEKLFIAQPPLTRAIKQLEAELGVRLFTRKPRGLELTSSGEYFLEQSKQILDKITSTVEDTRRIARHHKTIFSIGFVPSVFYGQLPLLVRRLRENKNLEILLHELKTLDQVEALKTGKIDIGFGRLFIEDPAVEQQRLFDEPMIAALPAGHRLSHRPPSMRELSELPLITFPAGAGPNFSDITQSLFHSRGLKIQVIQQVNEVQTALSLVASDMGFSLVPEQVRRMQREDVDYLPLEDNNITTPVIASRRKGDSPSAVMRLANTILAELVDNRLTGRYP